MTPKKATLTVFSIVVLMAAPFILSAPAEKPQGEANLLQAQGELLRVDPDTSTLTIKSEAGQEIEFSYNESTIVMGADEDAAGLATFAGSNLAIQYRVENDQKVAVKIHVE